VVVACERRIFRHHIVNVEIVFISLALFVINYSSKKCVKECISPSNCKVFFLLMKNCLL
jgi:hypothetical protein